MRKTVQKNRQRNVGMREVTTADRRLRGKDR